MLVNKKIIFTVQQHVNPVHKVPKSHEKHLNADQWSSESGCPHLKILTAPSDQDSTRRRAIMDIVDVSVPTKPAPNDCIAASIKTGYLNES